MVSTLHYFSAHMCEDASRRDCDTVETGLGIVELPEPEINEMWEIDMYRENGGCRNWGDE